MGGLPGLCAFPPCPHQAVAVVRLLVDGWPVEMRACQGHRNWLTGYVLEAEAVLLVDVIPEDQGAGHAPVRVAGRDRPATIASSRRAHPARVPDKSNVKTELARCN